MALLQTGEAAPTFKGQNLTGPEFDYTAVKGQKPIVVVFAPDQVNPVQTKQTAGVYNKYRGEVEMVIMARKLPSVAMAKMVLKQQGLACPVIYDPKQEVYKLFGVEKPVVIFSIDKDGNIKEVAQLEPKGLTPAQLESAVEKAK